MKRSVKLWTDLAPKIKEIVSDSDEIGGGSINPFAQDQSSKQGGSNPFHGDDDEMVGV